MPDEGRAPTSVECKHRNQVDGGECPARQNFYVRAVGGVEIQRPHGVAKEHGVHLGGVARSILFKLDFHHGSLGFARQPRDAKSMGIGFLQLIRGSMNTEFAELIQGPRLEEIRRE